MVGLIDISNARQYFEFSTEYTRAAIDLVNQILFRFFSNLITFMSSYVQVAVMYGNPEVTSGGLALKFFASLRLEIRNAGKIKSVSPQSFASPLYLLYMLISIHGLLLQWCVLFSIILDPGRS